MSEALASKLVGTLVADRYRVLSKLAAGGMGVVFLAEQLPLGRRVALKILDTQQLDEARARDFGDRFFLEAAAVSRLQHPNTITVYDFGKTPDEVYYYAMEYVDGASLGQYVQRKGPFDPAAAIHVGLQICGSLHEAHLAGLIHRDLKPGNIMLTSRLGDPQLVKVLDFGLVKVMGGEDLEATDLTRSGVLLGSPRYMAPEQILRSDLDPRCDLYALGGVLYHALTGAPPFRHGSQFEVLRAQVEERPAPLAQVYPASRVSPRLEAAVMRCLEKDREARFSTMADLAAELVECGRELGLETSLGGALRGPMSRPSITAASELRASATDPSATKLVSTPEARAPSPSIATVEVDRAARGVPLVALAAAAALLLVAGGGMFALVALGGGPEPSPPGSEAAEPGPVESSPTTRGTPAPPAQAPEAPAASAPTPVRLESTPPGARVRRGEADLGDAPFSVAVPDGETWELTFALPGHEPRTVLVASGRDVLHVRLEPMAPTAPTPTTSGSRRRPPLAPLPGATLPSPAASPPPAAPVEVPRDPPPRFQDRGDLRHPWGQ